MALWTYAYFVTGTLWLIPWGNFLPRWAAEWLRINRASLGVGVSAVRWDVDEKTWKRLGSNVTLPIGAFDEWISLGGLH
jgi:hypothetical protein